MNKKIAAAVLLVVVLVAGGIILYIHRYGQSVTPAASSVAHLPVAQINSQTAESDPAFAQAEQFEAEGQYASAIPELQSALGSTNDPLQTAAILSHLQQDYEATGAYANAIGTLQQIAETGGYAAVTRAYAVEELGLLYVRYQNASSTQEIFAAAPYQSLYVPMNTNRTARNIFAYATTIYPLPISEYYIAESYSNSITNKDLLAEASSTAEKAKLATLEQELVSSFQAGNAALAAVMQNPPTAVYILNAQLMKAVVLGYLQDIGNTSFGDAGQAFQTVLTAYDSQNAANDGSVRLQYAYFLANTYGESRASDIQSVLAPLYQSSGHGGVIAVNILKGYIGAPMSPLKVTLVSLSIIDPDFKTFLTSLGWTSADFSTSASQ